MWLLGGGQRNDLHGAVGKANGQRITRWCKRSHFAIHGYFSCGQRFIARQIPDGRHARLQREQGFAIRTAIVPRNAAKRP